jgi:hypothetical protein
VCDESCGRLRADRNQGKEQKELTHASVYLRPVRYHADGDDGQRANNRVTGLCRDCRARSTKVRAAENGRSHQGRGREVCRHGLLFPNNRTKKG